MKIYVSMEFMREEKPNINFPEFHLNEAMKPWDEIEIHPIIELEEGVCEIIQEGKESFWSVYLHQLNGGLECIADLKSKLEAELLAELIYQCSNTRIHSTKCS